MDSVPLPNIVADADAGIKIPVVSSFKQAVTGCSPKGKSAFGNVLETTIKDGEAKNDRQDVPANHNSQQQALLNGLPQFAAIANSINSSMFGIDVQVPVSSQIILAGDAKEGTLALAVVGAQPESAILNQAVSAPQIETLTFIGETMKNSGQATAPPLQNNSNLMPTDSHSANAVDQSLLAASRTTDSHSLTDTSKSSQILLTDTVSPTTQTGNSSAQIAGETTLKVNTMPIQEVVTTVSQTNIIVPADYQMKTSQIASVFKASTEQQQSNSDGLPRDVSEVKADVFAVNQTAVPAETTVTALSGFATNDSKDGMLDQHQNQSADDKLIAGPDKKPSDVPIPFSNFTLTKQDQFATVADSSQLAANTSNAPVDPYNVVSQIVEHARLIKTPESSEMVIKLKPEHLGELTLKVSVDGGVVNASFHSNNAEVRSIIESSLVQLRQDMAGQGLKVDNVGVYAGLGNLFSDGQQRSPQQNAGKTATASRKAENMDFIQAVESVEAPAQTDVVSGVDYKI